MSFRRCGRRWWPALILGVLASCSSPPREAPAPVDDRSPLTVPAAPLPAASAPPAEIQRARSRWVLADWSDLPGWEADNVSELWPALLRSCERPGADWARVCSEARKGAPVGDAAVRAWLQQRLVPYRVESGEGQAEGMITGYFEPLIDASRMARAGFRVPLYQAPPDLGSRKPYWTRQQVDTLSAAKSQLRGRELAFVADPLDALILQIQGSGRLQLTEPDGERKLVRAAFAGHNEHPYKSVGRWLIEQGELKAEQASWPAIKAWARANPKRVNELLWSNPRVVFFREEPLPDPAIGPKGAQGVPLTPGRSIAVDAQSIPYGTPVWLDTTEPLSNTPLRRAVMAQDTGSAITGAVRADYFWGWGEQAEAQAGRMKQPLRLWALWPRP
ncbi:membrane-bound lytic murein transglycosylase A [Burkholderiaceae bacterium]|nr:membrane-bound lytic murein transglycosylase A [Burkholderiaceae bacterium]